MTNNIDKQTFGQSGATYVAGGGSATGAQFSSVTWPELTGTFPTATTILAGTVIYGQITAFVVTSGKVIAYKQV